MRGPLAVTLSWSLAVVNLGCGLRVERDDRRSTASATSAALLGEGAAVAPVSAAQAPVDAVVDWYARVRTGRASPDPTMEPALTPTLALVRAYPQYDAFSAEILAAVTRGELRVVGLFGSASSPDLAVLRRLPGYEPFAAYVQRHYPAQVGLELASMVEYTLIVGIVALMTIPALRALGKSVEQHYSTLATQLQ